MSTHTPAVLAAIAPKVVKPAVNGEQATHPAAPAQAEVAAPTDVAAMLAAMAARLNALEAENAQLKARKSGARREMWVSEKGALCVTAGERGWPVTLYGAQWDALLAKVDAVKAFLEANRAAIKHTPPPKAEGEQAK